jgi:hypothetical protein
MQQTMKHRRKRHSNPISVGLALFFGVTAAVLTTIRLAVEGGLPGSVVVAGLAPIFAGLIVAGLIEGVCLGVVALNCPGWPARACGRRP